MEAVSAFTTFLFPCALPSNCWGELSWVAGRHDDEIFKKPNQSRRGKKRCIPGPFVSSLIYLRVLFSPQLVSSVPPPPQHRDRKPPGHDGVCAHPLKFGRGLWNILGTLRGLAISLRLAPVNGRVEYEWDNLNSSFLFQQRSRETLLPAFSQLGWKLLIKNLESSLNLLLSALRLIIMIFGAFNEQKQL